ncbi:MAG: gliding motility-associated C-terminal domain-containing protein [Ferruginibacter sp.]
MKLKKEPVSLKKIGVSLLFISFFLCRLQAQICSGSLGDPVVNVTFGAGSNPGAALSSRVITYSYHSSDCPNDGFYTIINNTSSCFSNSWHNLQEDHTPGDNNGYMLLVNASFNPGDFYIDTVKNLCANTTYEFSAWATNVLRASSCGGGGIRPNLAFKIEAPDGTVLGSYLTGDIDVTQSPTWKQYGLFFVTPAGNSTVVIRITNNAPGGCGNDLAIDDITFRPCGPQVEAGIGNNNTTSVVMCKESVQPVSIKGSVGTGYISPSLQWQESINDGVWTDIPGATTNSFTFTRTATGLYQYRLAVAQGVNIATSNCRVISKPDTVEIKELLPSITSNSPICEEAAVQLEASGGTIYNWAGPAGFSGNSNPVSFPAVMSAAGLYTVNITDNFGCKATTSTTLAINPRPVAVVSSNKTICSGNSTLLESSGGTSYLWSPVTGLSDAASPAPTASPASTTTYTVVASNNFNCKDTAAVIITVNESPEANAGPDLYMLKGEFLMINGTATGGDINITWTPADFLDDPTIAAPVTNIPHDTTYILRAISKNGCGTAEDAVKVKVYKDLYIPKAFTPNNDGRNDTWRLDGLRAFPKAALTVYDRLGKKIFEGNSNSEWDGTYKGQQASAGNYIYYLDLKNKRPVLKGNVLLIR